MIADFLLYHPSRPFNWRISASLTLCDTANGSIHETMTIKFVRAASSFGTRLGSHFFAKLGGSDKIPRPCRAHELCMTSDLRLKFEIEARILAGQSDDEIAAKTGCSPETVYWFEALHFCARDRLEYPGYVVIDYRVELAHFVDGW